MLLEEAVKTFLEARRGVVSAQTTDWYVARLGRLVEEVGGKPLEEVTLQDLRRWRSSLLAQRRRWRNHTHVPEQRGGLSPHTIDGHWRAARAFFKWLHREGLLDHNPAERLERPRRGEVPPKRLSRPDVAALLNAARWEGAREFALVRFLLATGVRASECTGMLRPALDLEAGCVTVHGKGNRTRVICFDPLTARALRGYLATRHDARPAVWLTNRGFRPLTVGGLRSMLRRLCIRAGIAQIGPHALRHTFAYEFLKSGGDPDLLRRQLGHTRLSTTYDNYVRWMEDDLRGAFKTSWLEAAIG